MGAARVDGGGLDPTVVNGGIINAYGTNARLGAGDWMVVEADESDGTFLRLPATAAIVTNIDPEHLDHYGALDKIRMAFQTFVENFPFYGFGVMCADHPEVLAMIARIRDRRIVSYGFSPQADARAVNVSFSQGASHFDAVFRDRRKGTEIALTNLRLPMPGEHNISNAIAAITVARELGVGADAIRKALNNFGGVKRRFTRVGEWKGSAIIDDYGHHPVEIAAVLKAARQAFSGPIIAIMQPHRYTRLRHLFEQLCTCMNSADTAIIAPVYPAREPPIEGVNRHSLIAGFQRHEGRRFVSDGDWRRLESVDPRWWHLRRGDPASCRFRPYRTGRRHKDARRRSGSRCSGRARSSRCGNRRPRISARHSGHHRRRSHHERRLLRNRDEGRICGSPRRRFTRPSGHARAYRHGIHLPPFTSPGDDFRRCRSARNTRRARSDSRPHGGSGGAAREHAAGAQQDRWFDVQESARP